MRMTTYTEYGLRLLMYVAVKPGGVATIAEVSQVYGISKNHLMKVAHELGRRGFLENIRGRNGGLKLARPAKAITVGEVVRVMEADCGIAECFRPESGGCILAAACRLRGVLAEALNAYWAVLDRYTLADLVARPAALTRILLAG